MVAWRHTEAPFSRLVLCDLDPDNVRSLRGRTASDPERVRVVKGDCNSKIEAIVSEIPEFGLNVALIDPFNLQVLKFETIRRLASFKRMDLIIHFPTADIKRNLGQNDGTRQALDGALGTPEWANKIRCRSGTDVGARVFLTASGLCGPTRRLKGA